MRKALAANILAMAVATFGSPRLIHAGEPLKGTKELTLEGDIASSLVDGVDRFLLREIAGSTEKRGKYWHRDLSSRENYDKSVMENRQRLAKYIGAVDARETNEGLELVGTNEQSALVGSGEGFQVYRVRWNALPGVHGEGLLLEPTDKKPVAHVIAIPDADQTPESLCGLIPGTHPEAQFARRLAESGCAVVIPTLMNNDDTYSVSAAGARKTNQPHREFAYRPAFEMGRHIIGFEVQKVLALVDYFASRQGNDGTRIGVIGFAEGGLVGLYAAALDTRIDAAVVSGYFGPRDNVWSEPIYRNVFALLDEFGDAEIASLVVPRALTIEVSQAAERVFPLPVKEGRSGGAAPGSWSSPDAESVNKEFNRLMKLLGPQDKEGRSQFAPNHAVIASSLAGGAPGDTNTLKEFLNHLGGADRLKPLGASPNYSQPGFDANQRIKRQLDEMLEYTQRLMREGEYVRKAFWSKADRGSVDKFVATTKPYREHFYNEVIGRFDIPLLPANVRTRKTYDEPAYTGYEVVMDVFPDVIAYGILLVPKDLKPGERRPVVVCQHGLEGRPQDVADKSINNPAYNQYAIRLAERGFITYAPQNLYIFQDRFRTLQRKGNVLKKTLFSVIVPQHEQATGWLASLPFVDPDRIAFYGLSYGGKTAMRVPSLVERYCLSICSADFNEWIWKNTSTRSNYSYVPTGEYEIFEFDLGNTYNYAEMAALIAPRPFMVERGHYDGVAPDEWVAYEYAKIRFMYAELNIPERTTIEFFKGPHTINGVGTFAFLHEHLNWPAPAKKK